MSGLMKNVLRKVIKAWDVFWFGDRSLLTLGLFRFILCSSLFSVDLSRQFDLSLFYSDQGLVPRAQAMDVMPEFYRPLFHWYFWPDLMNFAVHGFLVVGLAVLALGIGGRALNLVLWILHLGFLQRNYSLVFGTDLIGGIFLLLMVGTQSCARFSVFNLFQKETIKNKSDLFTGIFVRLIQIQLCVIYMYTGMEKLKGVSWWDGTALWSVLANPQMVIVDLTWIRHLPFVIILGTFSAFLFEIYFPVLIWVRQTRPYLLIAGFCFHMVIGLLMALMNFSVVMLAPYLFFLTEVQIERGLALLKNPRSSQSSTG